MREGRFEPDGRGARALRAGAEGERRGAGAALDPHRRTAAASSTRSTARTRCSSTRSARCASLALAHRLGHVLMEENDRPRLAARAAACSTRATTARYTVYYGEGRDAYDVRGPRRAREHLQRQRRQLPLPEHAAGLLAVHAPGPAAWPGRCSASPSSSSSSRRVRRRGARAARRPRGASMAFMLEARPRHRRLLPRTTPPPTASRTGTPARPGLAAAAATGASAPADPFNDHEPVDSSAAAIAAQGLLRLGRCLGGRARPATASATARPASTVARTLLDEPYLRDGPAAPGPAAALGLPPAQRLGLRAARAQGPVRRVEPCGATTTCASWRCYVQRLADGGPYSPSSGPGTPTVSGACRPRHGRHARHRPRHRARAGARGLRPRAVRRARRRARSRPRSRELRALGRRRSHYVRADVARRGRPRAARRRPCARASAGSTCSSTTPASRPRVRADLLDAERGELRGAAAHQPAGPVLPDAGGRALS